MAKIDWLTKKEQEEIENELSEIDELILSIAELDAQREADKTETQMAIAEMAAAFMGGNQDG